jgi:integrase
MPKLVRIKPGGNWYVAFTSGKRSRRVTTGTADKLEAERFLARVNAQLSKPPEPEQQTVSDLLDAYLADRKGNVSAYATLEFAVKKLKPYFGAAQPRYVTIEMSKSYLQLHRKKQSDGTTRRELGTLRAAFEFGRKHKWYERSPDVEMPPAPEGRQRWLTRDEADRLVAACKSHHIKTFMAIGIHTGARRGAIPA